MPVGASLNAPRHPFSVAPHPCGLRGHGRLRDRGTCRLVASRRSPDRSVVPDQDGVRDAVALDSALAQFDIPHDVKIYAGAGHSFFNDSGSNYNEHAAADSWGRTLAFFTEHLPQ